MEQGQVVRDAVQAGVWGEVRAKVEDEWVARSPQGQAEIVYAPIVANRSLILSDNHVMQ